MFMKSGLVISAFVCLMLLFIWSCRTEHFTNDPSDLPTFSEDTLSFDTVFTTIGSASRYFKIYNTHADFLKITQISLAGGSGSHFHINVDGLPGIAFRNLILRPGDSLYVFCEVLINPADPLTVSPYIIQDSIEVETNGVTRRILLEARGQNANYYPSKSNKGNISVIDLGQNKLVWSDPKPYIIYGIVVIDHGTLEIAEGTQVHFFGGVTKAKDDQGNTFFYNDGRLVIGSDARLKIMGSTAKPVICQGVRLESSYAQVPGQWSGIFLDRQSKGNMIHHAVIRNNLIGIYADSLSNCEIDHVIFAYNSYSGVAAYAANVKMSNCLFYEQGQSSFTAQCGGQYLMEYCTIANFGNDESGAFVSNNFCSDPPFCTQITRSALDAHFVNCVITGNNKDEFFIRKDPDGSVPFNMSLDHCLIKVSDLLKPDLFPDFMKLYTNQCTNRSNLDSLFKNISTNDFHPDTLSVLEKKAIPINSISDDLEGNSRDLVEPDLGCYEYIH